MESCKFRITRIFKYLLGGVFEAGINPPTAMDKGGGKAIIGKSTLSPGGTIPQYCGMVEPVKRNYKPILAVFL